MSLRGKGSFNKVMSTIDELLRLRAEGRFKGKLSIHTVISDRMIGRLYELMELYESKAIDLVLLCFPWYISEETSREMDAFVLDKFDWLIDLANGRHSWDAFKYRIGPESVDALMADLRRINLRTWTTKVRYQPGLEFDEIEAFVRGKSMTALRHHMPGASYSGRHHAYRECECMQILLGILGREFARSPAQYAVAVRTIQSDPSDFWPATLAGVLEVQRPLSARAFRRRCTSDRRRPKLLGLRCAAVCRLYERFHQRSVVWCRAGDGHRRTVLRNHQPATLALSSFGPGGSDTLSGRSSRRR